MKTRIGLDLTLTALGIGSVTLLVACASSDPAASTGDRAGSGSSAGTSATVGSGGSSTSAAGSAGAPSTAGSPTTGGSGVQSSGGMSSAGGAPSMAGSSATAGASSGSGGGAPIGGGASLPDVGSDGDGDSMISTYTNQKELTDQGSPKGKNFSFTMKLADSKLFDGKDPTLTTAASTARSVGVYVPAKFDEGMPAPVLVIQDGPGELNQVARALDNLTISTDPQRKLPAFVVVAVGNGGSDSIGSERGLEYDTMSDKYARFVESEVLPAVVNNTNVKAAYPNLKFTSDPAGRGTLGCSSGAAAAFTMAWFRPDLFSRVIAYSTTLVAQQNPKAAEAAMYPDGAWDYHSIKELIKNDTSGLEKKLRIFINANENDNGATAAESGKHNWLMANTRTAAALKAKGFHYKFIEGMAQGHCAGAVQSATLADALVWAWRGYQPSGK